MSRTVVMVDDAGNLVDMSGAVREKGRFARFARRMLSKDVNPVLDYGCNGGDSLEISKSGSAGKVTLVGDLNVRGTLKINGEPLADVVAGGAEGALSGIEGTDNEITSVPTSGGVKIGLASAVTGAISDLRNSVDAAVSQVSSRVSKTQLAAATSGLALGEGASLDALIGSFNELLERLAAMGE